MKKHDKEILQNSLNNEAAVLKRLEQVYRKALNDVVKKSKELQDRINGLTDAFEAATDETEKAVIQSMIQSKVYQKQYQDALKKQISSILDNMQVESFKTIDEYLQKCYEDGFIGVMYSLQNQGIPLIMPINQESMINAVQLDSKISEGLYNHLGENVKDLKKNITAEVSRGISNGSSFAQVAQQLSFKMVGTYDNPGGALAYALRIARTEGHRIQTTAAMNACYDAKNKGCDIVKQWDATLDNRTRKRHRRVDGEIRELDERFSNGLLYPGDPAGGASEVIHCRCALLQRAKWALDEAELETLKERAEYFELDKTANFDEYKRKYLKAVADIEKSKNSDIINIEKCSNFDELKTYFNDTYSIKIDNAISSLDFEAVKEPLSGIEWMFNDFPELSDTLKTIKVSKGGIMSCSGDAINFNPVYYTSNEKIQEMCKKYGASGFWPKNNTPSSIGTHEAAHGVEWLLCNMNTEYEYPFQRIMAYNKCTEAQNIVGQACKNIKKTAFGKGKKNAELKATISRYANDNPSEAMAEAFTDVYVNGENASPLSIEIRNLTVEQYKKYKGGV